VGPVKRTKAALRRITQLRDRDQGCQPESLIKGHEGPLKFNLARNSRGIPLAHFRWRQVALGCGIYESCKNEHRVLRKLGRDSLANWFAGQPLPDEFQGDIEPFGCQMKRGRHGTRRVTGFAKSRVRNGVAGREDDVVFMNTCSVRSRAERKVFRRFCEIRKSAPAVLLGVRDVWRTLEGPSSSKKRSSRPILVVARSECRIHRAGPLARGEKSVLIGERQEAVGMFRRPEKALALRCFVPSSRAVTRSVLL